MNHSITSLFAIPLYQAYIPCEQHIIDFIETQTFNRMPADNGSYTENKKILHLKELQNIKSKIQQHIDYFVHDILDCDNDVNFEIQNSWVNRHVEKDFAGTHRHNNSIISGVYYLQTDAKSGAIVFQKDKSFYNLWTDTIEIGFNYQKSNDQSRLNNFNADAWGIYPKTGDLLLFPSLLYHSVLESQSENIRYSLAFNVFPKGNFGSTINHLTL